MLGHVLVEVSQAQTVDIVGERCEATAKGQRDVRAAQLALFDDIINLQVRIQVGLLLVDIFVNE
jgi:hypothetical protein